MRRRRDIDPIEAGRAYEALGAKHLLAKHWAPSSSPTRRSAIGEPPVKLRAYWTERALDPAQLWILDPGEPRVLGPGEPRVLGR